jgi:ferrochelatase
MGGYVAHNRHRHDKASTLGVLLTNLGTPDAPTASAVRRYLGEFLWDPRVVEAPRLLWWSVLHGVILRLRPRRSARAYRSIWTEEGSPLLVNTAKQARAVGSLLAQRDPRVIRVAVGMRYGNPSLRAGLEALRDAGSDRMLVLPLYPQYSATTTASTFDELARVLGTWRRIPEFRMVMHYHDHPAYLDALAGSITEAWSRDRRPERLLFSFHGIPQRYFMAGDPYPCECRKTARLVAERLAIPETAWSIAFQSRLGREEWLRPYTDEVLRDWARSGVRRIHVVCPGFSADCLETLEEVAVQYRELFRREGGEQFHYIPALNDSPRHVAALVDIIQANLGGWTTDETEEVLRDRAHRAMKLGAAG